MGSTPSRTQVKTITVSLNDACAANPSTGHASSTSTDAWERTDPSEHDRVVELEKQLSECEARRREAEEQAKSSAKQAEVLQEEVRSLRSQLSDTVTAPMHLELQAQKTASTSAQEQLIKKLEEELTASKQEMQQMKEKFGCKLRKMRSSLAKSQAESALTVFELKDENSRLQEENTRLSGQVRELQRSLPSEVRGSATDGLGSSAEHEANSSGGHVKLILELSQQVSALDCELRQAQETIRSLEKRKLTGGLNDKRSQSASSSNGYFSLESSKCSL